MPTCDDDAVSALRAARGGRPPEGGPFPAAIPQRPRAVSRRDHRHRCPSRRRRVDLGVLRLARCARPYGVSLKDGVLRFWAPSPSFPNDLPHRRTTRRGATRPHGFSAGAGRRERSPSKASLGKRLLGCGTERACCGRDGSHQGRPFRKSVGNEGSSPGSGPDAVAVGPLIVRPQRNDYAVAHARAGCRLFRYLELGSRYSDLGRFAHDPNHLAGR